MKMQAQKKDLRAQKLQQILKHQKHQDKRKENGKNHFVHTLNGSALAVGRTLIALIENNFNQKLKLINIPKELQNLMDAEVIEI